MINKMIKFMRKAAGYDQSTLGQKVGVAQRTISGYELGENKPSYTMVRKIAKACDFEILFIDTNSREIYYVDQNGISYIIEKEESPSYTD